MPNRLEPISIALLACAAACGGSSPAAASDRMVLAPPSLCAPPPEPEQLSAKTAVAFKATRLKAWRLIGRRHQDSTLRTEMTMTCKKASGALRGARHDILALKRLAPRSVVLACRRRPLLGATYPIDALRDADADRDCLLRPLVTTDWLERLCRRLGSLTSIKHAAISASLIRALAPPGITRASIEGIARCSETECSETERDRRTAPCQGRVAPPTSERYGGNVFARLRCLKLHHLPRPRALLPRRAPLEKQALDNSSGGHK
jgi:hypothetical protein